MKGELVVPNTGAVSGGTPGHLAGGSEVMWDASPKFHLHVTTQAPKGWTLKDGQRFVPLLGLLLMHQLSVPFWLCRASKSLSKCAVGSQQCWNCLMQSLPGLLVLIAFCVFYQSVKILPHRLFYLYFSVEPKYLSILLLLVAACSGVWCGRVVCAALPGSIWGWLAPWLQWLPFVNSVCLIWSCVPNKPWIVATEVKL